MVYFTCTPQDFIPIPTPGVRWLSPQQDYPLAKAYWAALNQKLAESTWLKAHEFGYQYAAILAEGQVLSCAAIWRFSDTAWEIAAVGTLPGQRRRGHSRQVVAFLTAYTLEAGRTATCSTADENAAMIATAKSVGFQQVPAEKAWWVYPTLPDF